MKRLSFFISCLLAVAAISLFFGQSGYSIKLKISGDTYSFTAATSVALMVGALLKGLVLFGLPRSAVCDAEGARVGVMRRFAACYADLFVVSILLTPFLALLALYVEAGYEGQFQWAVSRDFARPSDASVVGAIILITFAGLGLYHYLYLIRGKATVGQFLLGYAIRASGKGLSPKQALTRLMWSAPNLFFWPITVFIALMSRNKIYWFDRKSESLPVRMQYSEVLTAGAAPSSDT